MMTEKKQENRLNTTVKNPEKYAQKLFEYVSNLFNTHKLSSLYLKDTYEGRIYIETLQRYSSYCFDETIMKELVKIINSSGEYTATFCEKVYVYYAYVSIKKI